MNIESAKVLRNGKVLTNSSPQSPTKNMNLNLNLNMESSSNSADEINQSGRNSPTNENSTQRENEERFDRLHNEMAMLKAMMEKIISQNEERDKQNGGSTATSSYAVGTSNTDGTSQMNVSFYGDYVSGYLSANERTNRFQDENVTQKLLRHSIRICVLFIDAGITSAIFQFAHARDNQTSVIRNISKTLKGLCDCKTLCSC